MNTVLLGNLITFAGAAIMVLIGFIKRREMVLAAQCVQFGVMGAGNLVLGGITGGITNFIGLIRNLICYKFGITVPLKIIFIVVQGGLALWVNNHGLIGLMPVLAAIIFTWFLDVKSDRGMKILILCTQSMWLVYDLTIMNYVAFVFDILCLCSNAVGLFRVFRAEKG